MSVTRTTTGWLITCPHCTWELHHQLLNAATAALHRHTRDKHPTTGKAHRP